jgi:hypothetical protein
MEKKRFVVNVYTRKNWQLAIMAENEQDAQDRVYDFVLSGIGGEGDPDFEVVEDNTSDIELYFEDDED